MSPHPYRFALSCLDSPPAPCEPPKKRRIPIEALILACAFIAAGTGVATLRAVGHGGHVEIGPAALAHVKKGPKSKPAPPPRHREDAPTAIAQAPLLRGGTHDPKMILAAAKQLETLGVDVTVSEVQLAKHEWSETKLWPARFISVRDRSGNTSGLELQGIPRESPLRAAGFADGDQLLSVNGYDVADGRIIEIDGIHTRSRGWVVAEIARGDHHVVLSIRWPVG